MSKNTGLEYEKVVQKIYSQIVSEYDVTNSIQVLHNVKIKGNSGILHQIDVYWEFEAFGLIHRVIIQAKDHSATITQGSMIQFAGIVEDLPFGTQGVFVTRKGYQKGAVTFAENKGIKLIKLSKTDDCEFFILISHFIRYVTALKLELDIPDDLPELVDKINLINEPQENFMFKYKNSDALFSVYDVLSTEFEKYDLQKEIPKTQIHFYPQNDLFLSISSNDLKDVKVSSIQAIIYTVLNEQANLCIRNIAKYIYEDICLKFKKDYHFVND